MSPGRGDVSPASGFPTSDGPASLPPKGGGGEKDLRKEWLTYLPDLPTLFGVRGKRNGAGAPVACLKWRRVRFLFSLRFFRGREGREGRETPSFIGIASPQPSVQRSGRGRDLRAIARPNNKPPPLRSDPHCSADNTSKATTVHSGKTYPSPEI